MVEVDQKYFECATHAHSSHHTSSVVIAVCVLVAVVVTAISEQVLRTCHVLDSIPFEHQLVCRWSLELHATFSTLTLIS